MKKLFVCLILFALVQPAAAISIQDHIVTYYPRLVEALTGFYPEPLAKELGQYSLVRQYHEDGPSKDCSYSAVGMYPGEPNSSVVRYVETLPIFLDIRKSIIPTPEGTSCYAFKGPEACIASALSISFLFDKYVDMFQFSQDDRYLWSMSKAGCPIHLSFAEQRQRIIKRANSIYGPQGSGIAALVKQFQPLFAKDQ